MTLTPQQRRTCLEVMGITVYRPRLSLPGAAPGDTVAWPPAARSAAPAAADRPETAPAQPQRPAASAILDDPVERRDARAEPVVEPVAEQAPATVPGPVQAGETGLRYRVVLVPVNERLSLIEQLPADQDARLTLAHLRLLDRVLQSLGIRVEPETLRQQPFQWPMVDSGRIDASATAGRRSLRVFAESNLPASQAHVLWLMGEGLPELFSLEASHRPLDRTPGLPWHLLATVGLSQMLQDPARKRELWRQLGVLRRFLRHDGTV